jgi:hypothetical protein
MQIALYAPEHRCKIGVIFWRPIGLEISQRRIVKMQKQSVVVSSGQIETQNQAIEQHIIAACGRSKRTVQHAG